MKINELEEKLSGNATEVKTESKAAEKDDDIVTEEVKTASDPFEDMDAGNSGKIKMSSSDKKEETSSTSKFFENTDSDVIGDDDDVFVGEIEDNRKPNKVMIGDGEEEGSDDFEFL